MTRVCGAAALQCRAKTSHSYSTHHLAGLFTSARSWGSFFNTWVLFLNKTSFFLRSFILFLYLDFLKIRILLVIFPALTTRHCRVSGHLSVVSFCLLLQPVLPLGSLDCLGRRFFISLVVVLDLRRPGFAISRAQLKFPTDASRG